MFCPRCGTALSDEARFCAECGAPMAESLVYTQQPLINNGVEESFYDEYDLNNVKKKSKWIKIIGITNVVIQIVLAVVCIVFILISYLPLLEVFPTLFLYLGFLMGIYAGITILSVLFTLFGIRHKKTGLLIPAMIFALLSTLLGVRFFFGMVVINILALLFALASYITMIVLNVQNKKVMKYFQLNY